MGKHRKIQKCCKNAEKMAANIFNGATTFGMTTLSITTFIMTTLG